MSRPKKSSDDRRSRSLIFRLTEAEYQHHCAVAERAGLLPGELARRFTLKGGRRLVIQTSKRCDPAFLKRIDQIGHNLNQLVKNAHIFGRISPKVEMLCIAIDELIDAAIKEGDDGS